MAAETAARTAAAAPAVALSENAGAPSALRAALADAIADYAPEIISLSHDIHAHPEVGYREHHAVAAVADLLRAHGIQPRVGVYDMDTALRAEIGTGRLSPAGSAGSVSTAGTAGTVSTAGTAAPADSDQEVDPAMQETMTIPTNPSAATAIPTATSWSSTAPSLQDSGRLPQARGA